MKSVLSTLILLACAGVGLAQDKPLVFSDKSGAGQLWANISLTYLRLEEEFIPMVVGVQSFSDERAILTRDSFWLVVPDGRQYPLAELKDLRRNYDKSGLDWRMVSAAGIPVDLWARNRRLRESNFFPDIRMTRRPTVVDKVTLRRNDGMADLMYFITPEGFKPGMPFLLVVLPEGWETPLRLRLVVGE
jgi:hypothetical protein